MKVVNVYVAKSNVEDGVVVDTFRCKEDRWTQLNDAGETLEGRGRIIEGDEEGKCNLMTQLYD